MKHIRYIALFIVLLSLLCLYSSAVYYVGIGGKKLGIFTKPLYSFATLPIWIKKIITSNEFKGIPPGYIPIKDSLNEVNQLSYDLFATNSFWNMQEKRWDIRLFNLKTDSIIHEWYITDEMLKYDYQEYQFRSCPPYQTHLTENKSIITHLIFSPYIVKLDSNSNLIWVNNSLLFHHSINIDHDGYVWVPATTNSHKQLYHPDGRYIKNLDGENIPYREDYIIKIDANTGKIIYKKGLTDILENNNTEGLLYGFNLDDPFHLNDIEPATTNTPYWNKGDLFLSLRNRNAILHYRPKTDQLLNLMIGPFFHQHDVDLLSDSSISIFNNNTIDENDYPSRTVTSNNSNEVPVDSLISSEIIIYNYNNSSYRTYLKQLFVEKKIFSYTEGLIEWLSNGDLFIESNNQGIIYVISNKGKILLEKQLPTELEGYAYRLNWLRLYEDLNAFDYTK